MVSLRITDLYGSTDYGIRIQAPEGEVPKGGSTDYGIRIQAPEGEVPKDGSTDYGIRIQAPEGEVPKGGSTDYGIRIQAPEGEAEGRTQGKLTVTAGHPLTLAAGQPLTFHHITKCPGFPAMPINIYRCYSFAANYLK